MTGGVQLRARSCPTKFYHFKIHTLGNRGGSEPPVPTSRSAHALNTPRTYHEISYVHNSMFRVMYFSIDKAVSPCLHSGSNI